MKTLNLLPVFTRPSVFAAAISIVAAFAFVSSASAAENKFDALGGVTAEVLTPAAMDAIQGTGILRVRNRTDDGWLINPFPIGGSKNILIDLSKHGRDKVSITGAP